MSDADRLRLLRAQLEEDFRFIEHCARRHSDMVARAAVASDQEMATMAIAYLLHNLYTAIEGYLLRIAKHFENTLDDPSWHRELIDRMRIEIPGLRPAVISAELQESLDELRRFRHLFRNLYKSELKPARVTEVSALAYSVAERFAPCHRTFVSWLDELIAAED